MFSSSSSTIRILLTIGFAPLASIAVCLVVLFAWDVWVSCHASLGQFRGPIIARLTRLWRPLNVLTGHAHETYLALHKEYGSVVRVGPDTLSISDPEMIRKVYMWPKSDMYDVNNIRGKSDTISNIFSTRNNRQHSKWVRKVKPHYKIENLKEIEKKLDETIHVLLNKCSEMTSPTATEKPSGQSCPISELLSSFAWDAMSNMTFSEDLGLMTKGYDHNGFLGYSERALWYFAVFSQIPIVDYFFKMLPIESSFKPIIDWSKKKLESRQETGNHTDFLGGFLRIKHENPDDVNHGDIMTYLLSNVLAGSDTTASTMCSAVYFTLQDEEVHKNLLSELRDGPGDNQPSDLLSWDNIASLPYLDAVIRETLRIQPPVGLMLERVVPDGFYLPVKDNSGNNKGRFYVPKGTKIGMNPWVVNRDMETFGPKPHHFYPRRWLQNGLNAGNGGKAHESDDQFQLRLTNMNKYDLTFGAGTRQCLGKDLALLEIYKLVATLFKEFDMELLDDKYLVTNAWFVRVEDIFVRMRKAGTVYERH